MIFDDLTSWHLVTSKIAVLRSPKIIKNVSKNIVSFDDIWWNLVTFDDIQIFFMIKPGHLSWHVVINHEFLWYFSNFLREAESVHFSNVKINPKQEYCKFYMSWHTTYIKTRDGPISHNLSYLGLVTQKCSKSGYSQCSLLCSLPEHKEVRVLKGEQSEQIITVLNWNSICESVGGHIPFNIRATLQ